HRFFEIAGGCEKGDFLARGSVGRTLEHDFLFVLATTVREYVEGKAGARRGVLFIDHIGSFSAGVIKESQVRKMTGGFGDDCAWEGQSGRGVGGQLAFDRCKETEVRKRYRRVSHACPSSRTEE